MKKIKIKFRDIFVTLVALLTISYIILFPSCASFSGVTETTSNEKIEIVYKDSVRYYDSVIVIPVERYVDIVNKYDTLFLETSLAEAYAYVDSLFLIGEIKNKNKAQTEIIYKDNYITKDTTIYKEKTEYKDKVEYVKNPVNNNLFIWALISTLCFIGTLCFTFRKKIYKLFI